MWLDKGIAAIQCYQLKLFWFGIEKYKKITVLMKNQNWFVKVFHMTQFFGSIEKHCKPLTQNSSCWTGDSQSWQH